MARKKWPDEAPVFAVICKGHGTSAGTRHGDRVVGVDICNRECVRDLCVRCSHPHTSGDADWGWHYRPDELRPLTGSARAMLAIAKAAAK